MATPVILIFDVGKTNKKILLFDKHYNIVYEESIQLNETTDEDGFACEDVQLLTKWIEQKFAEILSREDVIIKAVNFSAYGASFVNLDSNLKCCTPLYNYLKPYPDKLTQQFYKTYGGESLIAQQTASPVLGSLNSGMQLYRLKYEQPKVYNNIKYALHLPQYLSFIISKKIATDISSVGCHTNLWNFKKNSYHEWVYKEELYKRFAPLYNGDTITTINNNIKVGIGLHDSSAALIPYLTTIKEPFVLISTGTWCISLNPFNYSMLTDYELQNDCLCYLSYEGKPVKASRLFAGNEHEQQVKKLADYFNKDVNYYKTVAYNSCLLNKNRQANYSTRVKEDTAMIQKSGFENRSLNNFKTYEEAYHQLIFDIIKQQVFSTKLVLAQTQVKKIFVDGGFGSNKIYMQMLAEGFNDKEVYAACVPQASALGAALVLHERFSNNDIPSNLIELKHYDIKNYY